MCEYQRHSASKIAVDRQRAPASSRTIATPSPAAPKLPAPPSAPSRPQLSIAPGTLPPPPPEAKKQAAPPPAARPAPAPTTPPAQQPPVTRSLVTLLTDSLKFLTGRGTNSEPIKGTDRVSKVNEILATALAEEEKVRITESKDAKKARTNLILKTLHVALLDREPEALMLTPDMKANLISRVKTELTKLNGGKPHKPELLPVCLRQ